MNAGSMLAESYAVLAMDLMDSSPQESSVDHVLTDPPYAKRTQDNVRHGKKSRSDISASTDLGFDPADLALRRMWAHWMALASRRWVGVFSDHESSMDWAAALERAGLVYVRTALWVRTGDVELTANRPSHSGAPQFTGDRPQQGHECIVLAHHPGKMQWNGGGRAAIYTAPVVPPAERLHSTQKPLELMRQIIRDFTQPGDTIVDPFCGVGTTLVAAKTTGRKAFGIEISAKYADLARRRVASAGDGV